MKRKVMIYQPKFLINGGSMQLEGMYVAVPDKRYKDAIIKVEYDGGEMWIKNWHKAVTFRRFHDKFGGTDYTLGYFSWTPEVKTGDVKTGLASLAPEKIAELRAKLK